MPDARRPRPARPLTRDSLDLVPGRVIGGEYVVESRLGEGWEGRVYLVRERRTGAARAAKLFFPERNDRDRAVDFYARKLEQLRECDIIIKYHHAETIRIAGHPVTVLISEFVDGMLLGELVKSRPGTRLPLFEALHVLHGLASGLEEVHARREYHGDLHVGNILVQRRGVHVVLKLVDLLDLGRPTRRNIADDVVDLVRLFQDMLGGKSVYASLPPEIKHIIAARRAPTIRERFPTAAALRTYLDTFTWSRP